MFKFQISLINKNKITKTNFYKRWSHISVNMRPIDVMLTSQACIEVGKGRACSRARPAGRPMFYVVFLTVLG